MARKRRLVDIDVEGLKVAPKAEVVTAAEQVERALNQIPYMAVGPDYAYCVHMNAQDDMTTEYSDFVVARPHEEIKDLKARVQELEAKNRELAEDKHNYRLWALAAFATLQEDRGAHDYAIAWRNEEIERLHSKVEALTKVSVEHLQIHRTGG